MVVTALLHLPLPVLLALAAIALLLAVLARVVVSLHRPVVIRAAEPRAALDAQHG
jgi:hypothetical protein